MSDDKMKLELGVDVQTSGQEKLDTVEKTVERLTAGLEKLRALSKSVSSALSSSSGKGDGDSAAVRSAREALEIDKDRLRVFKMQMKEQARAQAEAVRAVKEQERAQEEAFRQALGFNTRIARQRAQAEAEAEREIQRGIKETAKLREREQKQAAAEARKAAQEARRADREMSRAGGEFGRGVGRVRSGAGRVVAAGGASAAVLSYGAQRAVRSLTSAGVDIDEAITNAAIHVFGTQKPGEARQSAEKLRRKLMPLSVQMGSKTSEMLSAYVEAVQAGVEEDVLDQFVNLGSKYAKLNNLSLPNTLEESGYALQGLKSFGKLTPKAVSDYFNHMSYLVATTAANREQMSSFGKRGLAAGASVGMSADDSLAFGAAATAAGAEGSQAARMLSSQGGRIAGWADRAADISRHKTKSNEDRLFLQAPRILGFSSHRDMAASFKGNFFDTLVKVQQGLKQIADPLKRRELEKQLFGQEFGSFTDAMVMGNNLKDYREKLNSKDADNFIDGNWSKKTAGFKFIIDQITAVFQNLKDSLGIALEPLYSDVRDYAVQASETFGSLTDAFRSGLDGMLRGLGSPDGSLAGVLRRWFGDPAKFTLNARSIFDFARGFGTGLRETGETIRRFFGAFAGSDASAESIGRLTAKFLSLSAACIALSPVVSVIGGLAGIIGGLVTMARAAATLGGIGAGGAASVGAGALAGVARMLSRTFVLGLAAEIGAHRGEIATMMLEAIRHLWEAVFTSLRKALSLKGLKAGAGAIIDEVIPAPLRRWWDGDGKAETSKPQNKEWTDPPLRKPLEELKGSIDKNREAVDDQARVQKQAYEGGGFGGLIHKANLGGGAASIGESIRSTAVQAASSPLSGSVGGGGPALAYSNPGGSLRSGLNGMPRRGVIGGSGGAVSGSGNGRMPTSSSAGSLTDLINTEAIRAGIDPRIMQGIRAGESGHRADYDVKSDSKEDSYGPFQLNRRGGLGAVFEKETSLDARDPKTIPAQTRWVAELIKKRGPGVLRQWYGYHGPRDADPRWGNSGYVPNNPAGVATAGSANDNVVPNVGQAGYSKSRLAGQIDLEGVKYDYGSGGHRGANSIPVGTYPITPNTIGPWGQAHGALGINNNAIYDKELHRMRSGIEFHAASSASKLSAGCLAIERQQYAAFRAHVLKVIREQGSAYLTVGEDGRATITGGSPAVAGAKRLERGITDAAEKAKASPIPRPSDGSADGLGQQTGQDPSVGITGAMPRRLGSDAPIRDGGSRSQGGTTSGHAPMNIVNNFHGHNQNHEELANAVQRKLADSMRRRSHDLDYGWG